MAMPDPPDLPDMPPHIAMMLAGMREAQKRVHEEVQTLLRRVNKSERDVEKYNNRLSLKRDLRNEIRTLADGIEAQYASRPVGGGPGA